MELGLQKHSNSNYNPVCKKQNWLNSVAFLHKLSIPDDPSWFCYSCFSVGLLRYKDDHLRTHLPFKKKIFF